MKRIKYVRNGVRSSRADLRKAQRTRLRELKTAHNFAYKMLGNPKLKARYETLALERSYPDAYTAAMSIYLDTEASMRSSLKRLRGN